MADVRSALASGLLQRGGDIESPPGECRCEAADQPGEDRNDEREPQDDRVDADLRQGCNERRPQSRHQTDDYLCQSAPKHRAHAREQKAFQ
jgi:hypothetical protein